MSDRNREPACVKVYSPSVDCCCSMKPRPWRLASVQSLVGLVISKNAKFGATVSCSLAALKALSCIEDHEKSFWLLRRGLTLLEAYQ